MKCPNCRCVVPNNLSHCSYCGTKLYEGSEPTLTVRQAQNRRRREQPVYFENYRSTASDYYNDGYHRQYVPPTRYNSNARTMNYDSGYYTDPVGEYYGAGSQSNYDSRGNYYGYAHTTSYDENPYRASFLEDRRVLSPSQQLAYGGYSGGTTGYGRYNDNSQMLTLQTALLAVVGLGIVFLLVMIALLVAML